MLFKLIRLTRKIRTWLSGNKPWEERFKLFKLQDNLTPDLLYQALIPHCYQYNYMGACYRHQVFQVRRLTDTRHQVHLRAYKNGWVTGHYELQPEVSPMGHLDGVDLRNLTEAEINEIRGVLEG